jgi:pimeloyl-ACP methyl ester carboxylesterase
MVEAQSGEVVSAFGGSFVVPENRSDPDSRSLTLRYVRFESTSENPGPPIVYLAGGPGGSGIWFSRSWRFPLFMALREFGDVIAFDQRGTGESDDTPLCTSSYVLEDTAFLSDETYIEMHQSALQECLGFWKDEGIDVRGYTTVESVADLDALRVHLGAEKLSLWGISYGSHLALAAIKEMGARIARVVIASAEGLDQTIKQPERTDAYFDRLQDAINMQPAAREALPDIKSLIRRVHARLDDAPMSLRIPQKDGTGIDLLLQRRDMQLLASAMIADPGRYAAQLVQIYAALDSGDREPLVEVLRRWHKPNEVISYRAMAVMMDIASGIGVSRRKMIENQSSTALLGRFLNDTLYLIDAAPTYVLDDRFREKPVSDVPLLLFSGTLDGRTYIGSQRQAVSGLTNREMVTVINAGHNLFMASPEVTATVQDFMRGGVVDGREIVVTLPEF